MKRNTAKNRLVKAVFGCFLGVLMLIGVVSPVNGVFLGESAYAEPAVNENGDTEEEAARKAESAAAERAASEENETKQDSVGEEAAVQDNTGEEVEQENKAEEKKANTEKKATGKNGCDDSLGSIGWLICPTTGKIAEAVDWLYGKISDVLELNPVEVKNGSPVYEIWKYLRGVTNIVFIIFMLVVVYSQLTGVGITNYGIKKTLPKLIVAAVLVNLSFYICALGVDLSNIFGGGLRQLIANIEESSVGFNVDGTMMSDFYLSMASGTMYTAAGAMIAVETGAIWMLIPTVLGAIVSVVVGIITIAMRQALVVLLVMVAPLAVVAYILPNTEQWFKKWKDLLMRMLVFYPMFSLLFAASNAAGYAIIVSAKDGFGILLGVAVQIFPLIFAWSLMKMSGTILGTISTKLSQIGSRPVAGVQKWADSHRQMTRARYLAQKDPYMPSLRLRQFLANREVMRETKTKEYNAHIQSRGAAYTARKHYDKNWVPNNMGMESYEMQARNMEYERTTLRHSNNMNKGMGQLLAVDRYADGSTKAKLGELDVANVVASDKLKVEQARAEKIDYENAEGFYNRMNSAMDAHMDSIHGNERIYDVEKGRYVDTYKRHFDSETSGQYIDAIKRYNETSEIMEGSLQDVQYAAASAAHGYDTQAKIYSTKMQKYSELIAPTKDVVLRLNEFTLNSDAGKNIDAIIPGLRVLAARGDTDLVREQLANVLKNANTSALLQLNENAENYEELYNKMWQEAGIQLGTHASQALASFLMFDIGDKDPALKRFGKYINLETAHVFNKNKRGNQRLTLDEYLTGRYYEMNEATHRLELIGKASKDMTTLLEGTSFDGVERTAFRNLDEMLMAAYTDQNGKIDVKSYLARRDEIQNAIGPQFISASLKYLSGSEQLKSAVEFLTGYNRGKPRWADGGELSTSSDGDEDIATYVKEYFRKKTMDYLDGQTINQLLGFRSDYRSTVSEHLADQYLAEGPSELDKMIGAMDYAKMAGKDAELNSKLEQENLTEKEREDYEKMRSDLREEMAGVELRRRLAKSGKLGQIYETRRSGAANNAKDFVRKWLNLDSPEAISQYFDERSMTEKRKNNKSKKTNGGEWVDRNHPRGYYDETKRIEIRTQLDELCNVAKNGTNPEDEYYKLSTEYLNEQLGSNNIVSKKYKEYREHNANATVNDMNAELREFLGEFFAANASED